MGADRQLYVAHHAQGSSRRDYNLLRRIDPASGAPTSNYLSLEESRGQPPIDIVRGPGRSIWYVFGGATFVEPDDPVLVGRFDLPSGPVQRWEVPGASPQSQVTIEAGLNGEIWFTSASDDLIGRVDASVTEVTVDLTSDQSSVFVGEKIDYRLTITNTGSTTLTDVEVDDADTPGCAGPIDDLAADEVVTVDCSFTTTQPGPRSNTATVITNETGPVASNSVSTSVSLRPAHEVFTFTMTSPDVGVVGGEDVSFRLTVANTSGVALTDVVVTDANAPDCAGTLEDIPVGSHLVVECSVPASMLNEGTFVNRASVDTAQTTPSAEQQVSVQVGTERSVSVVQARGARRVPAGSPVTWEVTVTNTGDVPLGRVGEIDGPDSVQASELGTLAPGQQVVINRQHPTSGADLGTFTNVATVIADRLAPTSTGPFAVEVVIPSAGFSDVAPSAFFADAVDWAALFGVVPGSDDGRFRPSNSVTRSRMVSSLFVMMDAPAGSPRHRFADVRFSAPYRPAVDWAVEEGLVSGSRPRFDPTGSVSRADLVKMVWRMVGAPTDATDHGFTDVPPSANYGTALDWADANGLFDGFVGGSRFKPTRAVTRGQVADVLFRLASTEAAWPQDVDDPAPPSTVLF